jgi:hypothetical protein
MPRRNLCYVLSTLVLSLCLAGSVRAQQPIQPIQPGAVDAPPATDDAPPGVEGGAPSKDKPQIPWHKDYQEAFDASAKTGKPIYAFVYLPLERSCVEMARRTLVADAVVKVMANFECCAVSVRDKTAEPFIERFKVGPVKGPLGESRYQITPVSLFLGPDGTEYLRQGGYADAVLLEFQVQRLLQIIPDLTAARANPNDAVVLARIGHKYVAMSVFGLGREYLQRAVKADPNDALGAKSEASLDLIITSIDEDSTPKTEKAFADLMEFVVAHPDSPRRLEARFYMAAAQLVLNHDTEAKKILMEFAARGADSSESRSEWGQKAISLTFDILADEVEAKDAPKAAIYREMLVCLRAQPNSSRRYEGRYCYWMAQALLAERDTKAAEKVLQDFEAAWKPDDAPAKNYWGQMARKLLADVRAGRVGR